MITPAISAAADELRDLIQMLEEVAAEARQASNASGAETQAAAGQAGRHQAYEDAIAHLRPAVKRLDAAISAELGGAFRNDVWPQ